jgi:TolB-like protein
MADIFISYVSEDHARAGQLARALEANGHSVWWDRDLHGGADFAAEIERQLAVARAVIVLWSSRSRDSQWVRDEASYARDAGKLVPVTLDRSPSPLGFRQLQAIDLSAWKGDAGDAAVARLVNSLGHFVENDGPARTKPVPAAPRRARVRAIVMAGGALAVVLLVGLTVVWRGGPATDGTGPVQGAEVVPVLAVLPFVNLGGEDSDEFVADGVAEEILTLLAGSSGMRVISRTSAFAFKGQALELPVIAGRLGAGYVLEGSMRRAGDRVRVNVQLIDAGADSRLWTQTYERSLDDVFAIQSEVAREIARVLRLALGTDEIAAIGARPTSSLEAWQHFLEARYLVRTRRTGEDVERALDLVERALALDPAFARAQSQRALVLFLRPSWLEGRAEFEVQNLSPGSSALIERLVHDWRAALAAAELALDLDPRLGEPYMVRALHAHAHNDWRAAAGHYREAVVRAPNNPDLRSWYGSFLLETGHLRDALREKQRATELDPLSPVIAWSAAYTALVVGRSDLIVEHAHRAAANGWTGWQYWALQGGAAINDGDVEAAEPLYLAAFPGREEQVRQSLRAVRTGTLDAASRAMLADLMPYGPPGMGRFSVYCMTGANDDAIATLYSTVATESLREPGSDRRALPRPAGPERPGGVLRADWWMPRCAGLRADTRFIAFVDAIGLLDYWRTEGPPDLCEPFEGTFRCR